VRMGRQQHGAFAPSARQGGRLEQFIHSGVVSVDLLLCGRRGNRRSEHTRTVTVPIAKAARKNHFEPTPEACSQIDLE
jgi:hypothetical protein